MDTDDFVEMLRHRCQRTSDQIVKELGGDYPGSDKDTARRSDWYRALSVDSQSVVQSTIAYSIYSIVFAILCELDGVGELAGNPEEGMYELRYIEKGANTLLNPNPGEMHDLFASSSDEVLL